MIYLVSGGGMSNALDMMEDEGLLNGGFGMLDMNLLRLAKEALDKEAFTPLTPEAMAAANGPPPPMDPSMMGGAPPMDPSMMGGMPPQGGMPMDPSMMGGMPMDPSMMGGAPPMDPSMMGGAPPAGGQPVTVSLDDLRQLLAESGSDDKDSGRATNRDIMNKLDEIEGMLADALGLGGVEDMAAQPAGSPQPGPEDLAAMLSAEGGGAAPGAEGAPAPPAGPFGGPEALNGATQPPQGITATASSRVNPIMGLVRQLKR